LLDSFDELSDEKDILYTRLYGLMVAIQGLRDNTPAWAPPSIYREIDELARQWTEEAKKFFADVFTAHWRCNFQIGERTITAHRLKAHEDGYALFGTVPLPSGGSLSLDYAAEHDTPQDSIRRDLPTSISSLRQLYLGDTSKQIAVSLNEMARSLLDGGNLELEPDLPNK
jgi:hypothetical protein